MPGFFLSVQLSCGQMTLFLLCAVVDILFHFIVFYSFPGSYFFAHFLLFLDELCCVLLFLFVFIT